MIASRFPRALGLIATVSPPPRPCRLRLGRYPRCPAMGLSARPGRHDPRNTSLPVDARGRTLGDLQFSVNLNLIDVCLCGRELIAESERSGTLDVERSLTHFRSQTTERLSMALCSGLNVCNRLDCILFEG